MPVSNDDTRWGELLLVSLLTRLTIIAHTDLRMYVKTLKHAAAREEKERKRAACRACIEDQKAKI